MYKYNTPIKMADAMRALEYVFGAGNVKRCRRSIRLFKNGQQVGRRYIVAGKVLL